MVVEIFQVLLPHLAANNMIAFSWKCSLIKQIKRPQNSHKTHSINKVVDSSRSWNNGISGPTLA